MVADYFPRSHILINRPKLTACQNRHRLEPPTKLGRELQTPTSVSVLRTFFDQVSDAESQDGRNSSLQGCQFGIREHRRRELGDKDECDGGDCSCQCGSCDLAGRQGPTPVPSAVPPLPGCAGLAGWLVVVDICPPSDSGGLDLTGSSGPLPRPLMPIERAVEC